ncbi:hypothetical protein J8281_13095 [Aquimarina sp. U1-2]|nr:hypothetical protein [Aquimarina sp. U1-2]
MNFNLAKSVGQYFRLSEREMETILNGVLSVVKNWKDIVKKIGIKKAKIELMAGAF